ncbi:hypothetical protein K450DRAFT_263223 [Umbelopsis ramanniana AG]|uniref:Uncharacterized protein n=1 Tax=Umbelopsis ramanniana AG TaxID=1314678 RepID=A0AAD5E260_UMBRA|nr:uncharacterized protein K450DRAFT_263223 [Umbelopsis ramanniana AG]KAI8575111.1 hypothetical protein K450DRAFT_263223 [Umbelopsis ramanniana AG]
MKNETPESIKRHITDIKATLKLKKIERGTAKQRNSESISQIPPALNKLLSQDIRYCDIPVAFEERHINGSIGISPTEDQIDALVTKYSSKFVLAIIQSTSSWDLITNLDAFYQQDSSVDDCALPPNTDMDINAKAILLQETEELHNFKELIIQCGPIQLSAIVGYYGQTGSNTKTAFLGSALPNVVVEHRGNIYHFDTVFSC